ncbi:MAG: hypothetical protein H7838_11510 [Magnetococcus sp. DMHC-8]
MSRFLERAYSRTRLMAILSYLGVLCLIPLIFSRGDDYVNFHARQGLVLWIWGVLAIFSLHVPVLGPFFFSSSVFFITVLSMAGLLSVLLSRRWRFPVVGMLAGRL